MMDMSQSEPCGGEESNSSHAWHGIRKVDSRLRETGGRCEDQYHEGAKDNLLRNRCVDEISVQNKRRSRGEETTANEER
jgi:hypothetical protein